MIRSKMAQMKRRRSKRIRSKITLTFHKSSGRIPGKIAAAIIKSTRVIRAVRRLIYSRSRTAKAIAKPVGTSSSQYSTL